MKNKYNFWVFYKEFKKQTDCFRLWEWILSIAISFLVMAILMNSNIPDISPVMQNIGNLLFNASITILSLVIAGFAIYASLTDKKFSSFLYKSNAYIGLSFPFWMASILWGIFMLVNGIYLLVLQSIKMDNEIYIILTFYIIIFFCMNMFFTISIVGSIFITGYFRTLFYSQEEEEKEE